MAAQGWCSSAVPPLGVPADLAFGVPSSLPHRCRHCASSARRGSATATSLWHRQRCAPAAACWPAWWQRGRSWRRRRERHAGPCKTLSSLGFQTEESVARLDHNAQRYSRRRRFRPAAAAAAAPPALLQRNQLVCGTSAQPLNASTRSGSAAPLPNGPRKSRGAAHARFGGLQRFRTRPRTLPSSGSGAKRLPPAV